MRLRKAASDKGSPVRLRLTPLCMMFYLDLFTEYHCSFQVQVAPSRRVISAWSRARAWNQSISSRFHVTLDVQFTCMDLHAIGQKRGCGCCAADNTQVSASA